MSDFPSPDEWLANEPHEVECVPEEDPREECSRCLLLFDARDWPDCPRCLSAEKQAPISDFEWERTPTEPLGHKVERRAVMSNEELDAELALHAEAGQ